ncbi:MAG TPA: 4Fe-4S dicluster domain-containing protein [Casimicrobiaceae bacterium]|nr:4Fe-4S dicluster domain-containing protein [Casimicrobiaceae bacterium]
MTTIDKSLYLCSCNGTAPIDAPALADALQLSQAPKVHTMLCQKQLASFADGATGDVIVGCTQEARLFADIAGEAAKTQSIRFVNLRESGGWSPQARGATPKLAALLAQAALPDPEPVPSVSYRSDGQLLIVGPLDVALRWANVLQDRLAVTVLATGRTQGQELPIDRAYPVHSGTLQSLTGWLGEFEAQWSLDNPIDLDVCTRCNACIKVCPEHAIDWSYQIDLDKCRSHRDCVVACGAIGAIDFERRDSARGERFDLILDLDGGAFAMPVPPQGYFAPSADLIEQAKAVAALATMTGEFEKPKYFHYKPSICAHARSKKIGCTNCIDACDTQAIRSDGDKVFVEPHLCMGCGTCATVCPSGAMTYAYPAPADFGARLRTVLSTYVNAGGRDACLLVHGRAGGEKLARFARHGRGLPARVIPIEVHNVDAIGLDLWLAAIAWGAVEIAVLTGGNDIERYASIIGTQMRVGDTILQSLGYVGSHFRVVDGDDFVALDNALWTAAAPRGVRNFATFVATNEKRTTLSLALDHLAMQAPIPQTRIPLFEGSPFGAIAVNAERCTMCLACVGSCPEGAILDNAERLELRFIETKCVQCGICAKTCPEDAITLVPQLDLTPEARQPRVLNEAAVFACIACGKPLGSERMIGGMLAKLAGHSMFAAPGALERLKMCADCRVVDLVRNEKSLDIRNI